MMKMAGFDNFVSGEKKRVGANSFEYDCKLARPRASVSFLGSTMNFATGPALHYGDFDYDCDPAYHKPGSAKKVK